MSSGPTKTLIVTLLALAAWLLGTAPAGAGTMQLTNTSGLADGQIVIVNVSGFGEPDPGQLTLLQCRPAARSSADCDPTTVDILVTNGDGTGSSPFALKVRPGLCDGNTPCTIVAAENPLRFDNADPQSRFAAAPVSFSPSAVGASPTTPAAPPSAPSAPAPAPYPAPYPEPVAPAPAAPTAGTTPLPAGSGTGAQTNEEPAPMVPEVPWGLLLPVGAAATFAGAVLAARTRAVADASVP